MARRGGNATSIHHRPKDSRDFYATPPSAVAPMLRYALRCEPGVVIVSTLAAARILEPSAGRGGVIEGLIAAGARPESITAIEIDAGRCEVLRAKWPDVHVIEGDFLAWSLGAGKDERFDLVCMNPPYANDELHVRTGIHHLARFGTCAALMRQAFLSAGQDRRDFRKAHPHDRVELAYRLSFTAEVLKWANDDQLQEMANEGELIDDVRKRLRGSDAADHAWGLFGPGRGGRFWTVEKT